MPLGAFKAGLMGAAGASTAGDVVLLSTQTASDSASLSFTSGITSTYGEYIFKFYNMHPASTDHSGALTFQVNATDDAGGGYDTSLITSTHFYVAHGEGDGVEGPSYVADGDLAQAASFQQISGNIGGDADESAAGTLHLFNPSSTTYVKHFYSTFHVAHVSANGVAAIEYVAGYINDTTAIDEIQFKMSSGNFDGAIQMYGIA